MTTAGTLEIVLPSGRFARLRTLTVRDLIAANSVPIEMWMVALASRVLTIDEQVQTVEQILNMEIEEWMPVVTLLSKTVQKATTNNQGIA